MLRQVGSRYISLGQVMSVSFC